ncbi:unnamed protein product [Didymodactylos carnosus]|uniref:C2 domain-containing protein n=1 Tax=Didymodactylos carnosus TaxID=1234261 RepID=A0A814B4W9_9BILA|nr:unnamed protein product [Didymodactylos carnosus]CAF0922803.1 unnamed protein product [Didymodactylos carnosus]CAF3500077.1 unnamed protein product [Didymodactylos carnosus]CAF3701874.1 unnamed protein product [Didymodactylos carnosus]
MAQGQLQVTIAEGRNLKDQDSLGQNDAYIELYLDKDYKQRTSTKKDTNSPVWNETFVFNLQKGQDHLKLKVYDDDVVGKDSIGSAKISQCKIDMRSNMVNTTTPIVVEEKSFPDLKSRLQQLEVAMGVRLNVAKGKMSRHSTTTGENEKMQISPLSSVSSSSAKVMPLTKVVKCQRSSSSCENENKPVIKRLKATTSIEQQASFIKHQQEMHPPSILAKQPISSAKPVRKPGPPYLPTTVSRTSTPTTPKSAVQIPKTRTSVNILSNSSLSSSSNNTISSPSRYQTPMSSLSSLCSPAPPIPARRHLSVLGERWTNDIIKHNLLWLNLNELDQDEIQEVLYHFGSTKNFLHEQYLFAKAQKKSQFKKHKQYDGIRYL